MSMDLDRLGRLVLIALTLLTTAPALADPATSAAWGPPTERWGEMRLHPLPWTSAPAAATFTLAVGDARGALLTWPPDAPVLTVRAAETWSVEFGDDTLELGDLSDARLRWLTLRLDGRRGRIDAFIDGRAAAQLDRAPFALPGARWAATGPAAGALGPVTAWPDARPTHQILADALVAAGERAPAVDPPVELRARRGLGAQTFGCARFAPGGRWLAGCRSSLLVLFDRLAGARVRADFAHLEPLTDVDIDPAGQWIASASLDGEAALWNAASGAREVVLRHPDPVRAARFSPDGRWLATWGTAPINRAGEPPPRWLRIWPVGRDGAPLALELPAAPFDARWAPVGANRLAVLDMDGAAHLIDLDGALITIPIEGVSRHLAWAPDGRALVVGDDAGAVHLVPSDAPDEVALRLPPRRDRARRVSPWPALFGDGHPETPAGAAIVPAIRQRFGGRPWRPPEQARAVTALAVTDARVAVGFADGQIAVGSMHSGGVRRFAQPAPVTAIALTRGAHRVIAGGADGRLRWFDGRGRALGERALDAQSPGPVGQLTLSPDEAQVLISMSHTPRSALWPVSGPPPPGQPAERALPWSQLAVDESGTRAVIRRADGGLGGWDLPRLRPLPTLAGAAPATAVLWTSTGPVTGHADGQLIRWDPRTGARRWSATLHAPGPPGAGPVPVGGINALGHGPAGTYVAVGDRAISVIDVATDRVRRRIELPEPNLRLTAPTFDGRGRALIGGLTSLMRVDPETGAVDRYTGPPDAPGAPWFRGRISADGETVAATRQVGDQAQLAVWRAPGPPTVVHTLPTAMHALLIAFDPDGERLAVATAHREAGSARAPEQSYPVQIWRAADLAPIATLDDHRWAVTHLSIDREGRIETGSWDGYRRRFSADGELVDRVAGCPALAVDDRAGERSGAQRTRWTLCAERVEVERAAGRLLLLDGVAAAAGQWAIVDDDVFAGSDGAEALLVAARGPRLFDLDPIAAAHNRPDVIAARHGLSPPPLRADLERRHRRRALRSTASTAEGVTRPRVTIDRVISPSAWSADDPLNEPMARVQLTAHAGDAPLASVRLLADGVTVARRRLPAADIRSTAQSLPVVLLDGPNRLEVEAEDTTGQRSHRALARAEFADPRLPTLWFVGFGVSTYADPAIRDLRFAHRDVHDLALRFARARGFARVVSRGFTNHEVTDDALDAAQIILSRAAPRDTVVLFVSGHGLHAPGPDGAYHYLTHDARLDAVTETALPFARFEALIEATPARRRLMLIDTCESGERLPGDVVEVKLGEAGAMHARALPGQRLIRPVIAAPVLAVDDPRDRFIDRDLRRRTGAVVFSSSRGTEASWELERLQNGAFTEALLEAIGGAADEDGDGWLTVDELRRHVAAAVPRLTGDRQHPVIDRDNRAARIRLPVIRPR